MDVQSFNTLLTPAGQAVLAEVQACLPKEADYLAHFQAFSRRFPQGLTQAALEIAIQRGRAVVKFPFGDQLYFDRETLEQASPYRVAVHTARRYRGCTTVLDMGCAAGGDSLALAEHVPVIGLDLDSLRLQMARANLSSRGLGSQADWLQADLTRLPASLARFDSQTALFFDPARRRNGRRLQSVESYNPPLSLIHGWLPGLPQVGVKLSPGVSLDELTLYETSHAVEIEFISLDGELKEAVLWFGALRTAARRATLLSSATGQSEPPTLSLVQGETLPRLPVSSPQNYIYEPDAAVLRAGLVTLLGARLDAAQLDPDIAYLTSAQRVKTLFARCWTVQDWFPFQLKRLRAYLRARHVGRLTVKKRGSPLDPQELIRQLRLQGDEQALIFLTHLAGKPIVIVAAELG